MTQSNNFPTLMEPSQDNAEFFKVVQSTAELLIRLDDMNLGANAASSIQRHQQEVKEEPMDNLSDLLSEPIRDWDDENMFQV